MQRHSAGGGGGARREWTRLKCPAAPGTAQGMGLSLLLGLWSQDGQKEPGLRAGLGESRVGGWPLLEKHSDTKTGSKSLFKTTAAGERVSSRKQHGRGFAAQEQRGGVRVQGFLLKAGQGDRISGVGTGSLLHYKAGEHPSSLTEQDSCYHWTQQAGDRTQGGAQGRRGLEEPV